MAPFRETLEQHLKQFRAAPILFVGAGMSRRYLNLDDWNGLLRRLAGLTDADYDFYFASAEGNLPEVASRIAEVLHPHWWKDTRFKANRQKFEGRLRRADSALKAETSIYLADSIKEIPSSGPLADELELLRNVVIDGIITTNFDPLLEHLFPDFRVFVGQDSLLFNDALGVGEIYEIHGSHAEPDSLVMTTADYDRFRERNPYLAAKLMTLFVEHPIVFLGYSLADSNIAEILNEIASCLETQESIAKLADRLIFVQWDPEAGEREMAKSIIRVGATPIPVMTVTVPDFLEVFEILGGLRRGFPAKLLRQLKEQVYELILEDNPMGRLHVLDLDADQDFANLEIVFGVGAIEKLRAYVGLQREDLVDDVIEGRSSFSAARVVREALPSILSHIGGGNVPVFKYLRQAGLLDPTGTLLDPGGVDTRLARHVESRAKRLGVTKSSKDWAAAAVEDAGDLKQLVATLPPEDVLYIIPALSEEDLDPEELRRFLIKHEDLHDHKYHASQWIKMVCLYDWLLFGRQSKPKPVRGRRPRRNRASKK